MPTENRLWALKSTGDLKPEGSPVGQRCFFRHSKYHAVWKLFSMWTVKDPVGGNLPRGWARARGLLARITPLYRKLRCVDSTALARQLA